MDSPYITTVIDVTGAKWLKIKFSFKKGIVYLSYSRTTDLKSSVQRLCSTGNGQKASPVQNAKPSPIAFLNVEHCINAIDAIIKHP
jgi:hypothetical protein